MPGPPTGGRAGIVVVGDGRDRIRSNAHLIRKQSSHYDLTIGNPYPMDADGGTVRAASGLIGALRSFWRSRRFRTRMTIALDWQHSLISVIGEPTPQWRTVALLVLASKDEEFVLAEGDIEARVTGTRKWHKVGALESLLHLPVEVARNRRWNGQVDGGSLVKLLNERFAGRDGIEIRVRGRDHHRTAVLSNALDVSTAELSRKVYT